MSVWNERYQGENYVFGTKPNDFLRDYAHVLPADGNILCLGDGEGRNGVYLAEQGFRVTSLDLSEVGLNKAKKLAESRGVEIQTRLQDLALMDWAQEKWDGIVSIFCHLPPDLRKNVHQGIPRALKSRGVFLMEAYTPKQLQYKNGGPSNVDWLVTESIVKNELNLQWKHLVELDRQMNEGSGHVGLSAVIQVIGIQPEALWN